MHTNRILFNIVLALVWAAAPVLGEFPGERPFPGVTYESETRTAPPMQLFVVRIDLSTPGVQVHVAPGGPDPDGPGEWETTLMQPTAIAAREGFDIVVNGDFYDIRRNQEAASQPGYRREVWAEAIGPAVSKGTIWSQASQPRPCLVVRKDGKAAIEMIDKPPTDAYAVVSGNTMLVENGEIVPKTSKARHPRTVVGLDRKGTTLTILVVDGRRPGTSVGMSYEELSEEMLRLGCWNAINLDGGGSTVLAMRTPEQSSPQARSSESSAYKILNTPSDDRERPVANALGIKIAHQAERSPGRH